MNVFLWALIASNLFQAGVAANSAARGQSVAFTRSDFVFSAVLRVAVAGWAGYLIQQGH